MKHTDNSADLMGAIEQLSIKNMEMVSKIKFLESSITELEASQEISDEIERAQQKEIEMLSSKCEEGSVELNLCNGKIEALQSELLVVSDTCENFKMMLREQYVNYGVELDNCEQGDVERIVGRPSPREDPPVLRGKRFSC